MDNSISKKKILICGGTGFIGRRLVEELAMQGRNVNLLACAEIPGSLKKNNITIFKGNLLDKKTLVEAVKNSDIIVNLVGTFNEDTCCFFNTATSINLLDACKENKNIEKIVFISSEAVYGDCKNKPRKEIDPPKPATKYGFSKYLAEEIYKFYSEKYKIPVIILRLANIYGPGHKIGVVSECLDYALKNQPIKLHKDGRQTRDFLYVDDAVSGIIKSVDHRLEGFDIFNISGKKTHSLLELVSSIEKNVGRKIKIEFMPYKKQDIKYMSADYGKAKITLKYEPKVSLNEGIARTINYYKDN